MATAVVAAVAPTPARLVERLYSTRFYTLLQPPLTTASNLVPFAVLDVFIAVALVAWAGLALRLFRRAPRFRTAAFAVARMTIVLAAALYLGFLVLWGLNYRRVPLADKLGAGDNPVAASRARGITAAAIGQVNALYDPAHSTMPDVGINPQLAAGFARVQRELGAVRAATPGRPKPSLLDWYFRRAGVNGLTDPYFLETLVVRDLLPFERPFVVAHEWAHLAGYAYEGDANFVGWLTCVRAGGPPAYSGWLFLAGELMAAVSPRDGLPQLDAGPRRDRQAISERLRRNVSPRVSTAGWMVYDRYLKANRVEAGAESYAGVVRLVVGAAFTPEWVPIVRERPR